jgi:hypothetical protein
MYFPNEIKFDSHVKYTIMTLLSNFQIFRLHNFIKLKKKLKN